MCLALYKCYYYYARMYIDYTDRTLKKVQLYLFMCLALYKYFIMRLYRYNINLFIWGFTSLSILILIGLL